MKKTPSLRDKTLTILICCYNAGEFLSECMDSLIGQSASSLSYKILFINDASNDGSLERAKSYSKLLDNFILIDNKENKGLTNCCNIAIDIIDTHRPLIDDAHFR